MSDYDENNIKVLSEYEALGKFRFAWVAHSCKTYNKPKEWIERLAEAAFRSGTDLDWVRRKYLDKSPACAPNKDFESAFKQVLMEEEQPWNSASNSPDDSN